MSSIYSYTNDQSLVADCLKSNAAAQYYLYKKQASKFLGICMRYTNDIDTANEYLQQGFIRIFDNIHQFKNEGSLEGWMKRVLVTTILNELKKHKNHKNFIELDTAEDISTFTIIEQNFGIEVILKCISKLPEGYRTILNLYAIDGFSHVEIATKLNIMESTSRSQFNRAKKYLLKLLAEIELIEYKKLIL